MRFSVPGSSVLAPSPVFQRDPVTVEGAFGNLQPRAPARLERVPHRLAGLKADGINLRSRRWRCRKSFAAVVNEDYGTVFRGVEFAVLAHKFSRVSPRLIELRLEALHSIPLTQRCHSGVRLSVLSDECAAGALAPAHIAQSEVVSAVISRIDFNFLSSFCRSAFQKTGWQSSRQTPAMCQRYLWS